MNKQIAFKCAEIGRKPWEALKQYHDASSFLDMESSEFADFSLSLNLALSQWGTADKEIKIHFARDAELSKVLPFKFGVGQNIALHVLPTAKNYTF